MTVVGAEVVVLATAEGRLALCVPPTTISELSVNPQLVVTWQQVTRMKRLISAIVLLGALRLDAQSVSSRYVSDVERQTDFSSAITADKEITYLKWSGDSLISWQRFGSPTRPSVHLSDESGRIVQELVVWISQAVWLRISDVSRSAAGKLYVAGWAMNGEGTRAGFLFAYSREGKQETILRTAPYFPTHVCAADENSVWVSGGEIGEDYGVLREYNFREGLKSELLQHSTLVGDLGNFPRAGLGHSGDEVLVCNRSSVVLYIPEISQVIEHQLKEPLSLHRYQLAKLGEGSRPTGFSMSESGELFAGVSGNGDQHRSAAIFRIRRGVNGAAEWLPIKNLISVQGRLDLLGMQGDQVVYHEGRSNPMVHWSPLLSRGENWQD